jgi:hypothetical protein
MLDIAAWYQSYSPCNVVLRGDFLLGICVDLDESNLTWSRKAAGELLVDRGDGFTRTTPVCINFKDVSECILFGRYLSSEPP